MCIRDRLKRLRLEEMLGEVLSMLELAKRALNEESIELATAVFSKDNLLDEINAEATTVLAGYIKEHPESVLSCLNLVSVFRKLERSGDHIKMCIRDRRTSCPGVMRKYFFGASSIKSSRSIHSSPLNSIVWLPASGSSGLLIASSASTSPSG